MRNLAKSIISPILFYWGWNIYKITGNVTKIGMKGFRAYFVQSNGGINDKISYNLSKRNKKYEGIDYQSDLSLLTDQPIDEVVNTIKEKGYYIFEKTLGDKHVDPIVDFAKKTPAYYTLVGKPNIQYSENKEDIDFDNPKSPRYFFDGNDLLKCPELESFMFNKGLFAISNLYLNTKPIFDSPRMWWSFPFGNKETSNAAQMYHFDLPRLKWIKFFIYLTDVDENNGPHCFVESSHKGYPKALRKVDRILDTEIAEHYKPEQILEIVGKKGTVIAVDTRGFHKGKPLIDNKRLILQIQYCNSLYGAKPRIMKGLSETSKKELKESRFKESFINLE